MINRLWQGTTQNTNEVLVWTTLPLTPLRDLRPLHHPEHQQCLLLRLHARLRACSKPRRLDCDALPRRRGRQRMHNHRHRRHRRSLCCIAARQSRRDIFYGYSLRPHPGTHLRRLHCTESWMAMGHVGRTDRGGPPHGRPIRLEHRDQSFCHPKP